MMRDVVGGRWNVWRVRTAGTPGGAVGVFDGQVKSAHERAPGHSCFTEQVADVLALHPHLITSCRGANVADRIGVADHRHRAIASVGLVASSIQDLIDAVGLSRN